MTSGRQSPRGGKDVTKGDDVMFGVDKSEFRRIKKEALVALKPVKKVRQRIKNYNFGVSRADVGRYRRQARA